MKLIDTSIETFSELLAAQAPTPGGGSSAAVEAVLGVSLIAMVAAISAEKNPDHRETLQQIAEETETLRRRFLTLVDEDTEAYRGIMQARGLLHRDTETPQHHDDEMQEPSETQSLHDAAMQEALKTAVLTPYRILTAAVASLRLAKQLSEHYYGHTASDLGLGAQSLKTAAQGAELTMIINLRSVTDGGFGKQYRYESQALLEEAASLADDVYQNVRAYLMEPF